MSYARIALAGLAATVAYSAIGFLLFAALPPADELRRYAAVYRAPESHLAQWAGSGVVMALIYGLRSR
jgi:hypothetical protein